MSARMRARRRGNSSNQDQPVTAGRTEEEAEGVDKASFMSCSGDKEADHRSATILEEYGIEGIGACM